MTKPIPVILDGDPGHDDAIAWVLAKASPCLDIRAVTSVCGNQTIEKTTYNARRIMALIGLDVPVAKGDPHSMSVPFWPSPLSPRWSTASPAWTVLPCRSLPGS